MSRATTKKVLSVKPDAKELKSKLKRFRDDSEGMTFSSSSSILC